MEVKEKKIFELEDPIVTCGREFCVFRDNDGACDYVRERELELDENGKCLNYELCIWKKDLFGRWEEDE